MKEQKKQTLEQMLSNDKYAKQQAELLQMAKEQYAKDNAKSTPKQQKSHDGFVDRKEYLEKALAPFDCFGDESLFTQPPQEQVESNLQNDTLQTNISKDENILDEYNDDVNVVVDKKYKQIHEGHRERITQRLINGDFESYQTHELVEMMLYQTHKRQDTNPIAHALINKFGDITGILNADVKELMSIEGVGKSTVINIKSHLAIFSRYKQEKVYDGKKLRTVQEIFNHACNLFRDSKLEQLLVLCLDGNYCVSAHKTWVGSVNKVNVLAREIVGFCYSAKAAGVVIVHTHPLHSAKPSLTDVLFTKLLYTSLRSLDITLAEHLILGGDEYFSFSSCELIEKYWRRYNNQYGWDGASKLIPLVDNLHEIMRRVVFDEKDRFLYPPEDQIDLGFSTT